MGSESISAREPAAAPATSVAPHLSFGSRLVGIVDRPRAVLADVYASPRWAWLGPILLVLAGLVALQIVISPYSAELAREQIRQTLQSMPADQVGAIAGRIDRLTSPASVATAGAVTGAIFLLIEITIAAAILYFASLIAGGEVEFGPLFGMTAWTFVPFALRDVVEAVWVGVTRHMIVNRGLGWLVSVGDVLKDTTNFTYFVLSFAQIFVLWHFILVWAGLRGGTRLSGTKAAFLVLIYGAVGLGLRWIPIVVSKLFAPALGG